MTIRKATNSDREMVLAFCKNTFEWGDYIDKVWDDWLVDPSGMLLVYENKIFDNCNYSINAVIHLSKCPKNILWIEGLRVNKHDRKKGIASKLLNYCINYGIAHDIKEASALVSINNIASQNMLEKHGFYRLTIYKYFNVTLESKEILFDSDLFKSKFIPRRIYLKTPTIKDISNISTYISNQIFSKYMDSRYFESWKFYKLENSVLFLSSMINDNKILMFLDKKNNAIIGLCIVNMIIKEDDSLDDSNIIKYKLENKSPIQICYLNCANTSEYLPAVSLLLDKYCNANMYSNIQFFLPNFVYLNEYINNKLIDYSDQFILFTKKLGKQ